MQVQEILSKVNSLTTAALNRGLTQPKFKFEIESGKGNYCMSINWHGEDSKYEYDFLYAATPAELLYAAQVWVDKIQPLAERQRAQYRKAVAAAIDLGNKFGIEDAAINPLKEVMEKLSKNALEHHPAMPVPSPLRADLDDEIPF